MKPYHVGLVMGVFDLFHVGHLNLLKRAKEECDYLRVGVLCDDLVMQFKHKAPVISLADRMEILKAIRYVDEVEAIEGKYVSRIEEWHKKPFDCFFSGDDYEGNPYWEWERCALRELGSDLRFFPYTKRISSTAIRAAMKEEEG